MTEPFAAPFMPAETLHEIARHREHAYRALLALPRFARSLTADTRMGYRVRFGHTVEIGEYHTVWRRGGVVDRGDGPAVEMLPGMPMLRAHRWIETDGATFEPVPYRFMYDIIAGAQQLRVRAGRFDACASGDVAAPKRERMLWSHDVVDPSEYQRHMQLRGPIREWRRRGMLHRTGGPAVESPEARYWYRWGRLHRTDGPAVEFTDNPDASLWFVDGEHVDTSAVELSFDTSGDTYGDTSECMHGDTGDDSCAREMLDRYMISVV